MSVSMRDARGSAVDREWIESVYRDYLDDLAPLNTGIFPVLGEIGHREPDLLARWFADPSAHPLVILKEAAPVGFALITRASPGRAQPSIDYRMAEFFVVRTERRRGVGEGAVELILDRFAGRWEITEYLRNPGAVSFWRRVVRRYTRGQFQERVANGEVRQTFDSGRPRRV